MVLSKRIIFLSVSQVSLHNWLKGFCDGIIYVMVAQRHKFLDIYEWSIELLMKMHEPEAW